MSKFNVQYGANPTDILLEEKELELSNIRSLQWTFDPADHSLVELNFNSSSLTPERGEGYTHERLGPHEWVESINVSHADYV